MGTPGMLDTAAFGPFTKGVVDSANSSLSLQGAARSIRHGVLMGINRLSVAPGSQLAITLKDDAGTPANVTSVRACVPFADGSLAVGFSSVTSKAYLYRLDASLTGYYDTGGTFHASATAAPIAVLWTGITVAPDVQIAEGLGTAYIAHTAAADSAGLYWKTRAYTDFNSIVDLVCNGVSGAAGTDVAYFLGVVSFNQALWGFGYGSGATAATGYRPELLRFSPPSFGNLQLVDSITVGDRVRSQREATVAGGVAGQALIFGASNFVTRITGYGRDSWYKTPVDRSYGFVGPKAFCTAGDTLYYWSRRGPMRISEAGAPEPLWDALPATVSGIINGSKIVMGFDPDRDQVLCLYDSGSGVRAFAAFDTRRDVWLGPDNEIGLVVACAGTIEPYTASTATPPLGPSAAPNTASTTSVGQSTATANWINGDATAQTEISYGTQASGTFTVLTTLAAGVTSYALTLLSSATAYQWRVRHLLNGQYSTYLGPVAGSMFTTASGVGTLQPPSSLSVTPRPLLRFNLAWTNSGEADVQTEVHQSTDNATFSPVQTVANGVASSTVTVPAAGLYYFKVRHVLNTADSAFSNTDSGNTL